ncbi:MAG: hypothetical protein FJZ15_03520 [Candidatus Omnitrophica bacterium]|nr:hypothetical protein [Candidatus Omnitrophota bacterium]
MSVKTKSLENLEQKMSGIDENSIRYHVLKCAKEFKTSWIELGRSLYSVYKDKLYKEWGYTEFEAYTAKEIGIRKQTAIKLLKSYYFLEKEEPVYLEKAGAASDDVAATPSFEAVNVLRLAKAKKALDEHDYNNLKKEVFEKGKDASLIKKNLGVIIRERQELEPEEAQEQKRVAGIKRLLGTLKAVKREIEVLKLLPASLIKETENLIKKLEEELN